MRIRRRPTVLSRLEEAGRRTPSIAATPLAGGEPGPEGPAGKEGKEGKAGTNGAEGAKGATGAAGPTSGGLILTRAATTAALAANTAPSTTTLEATANAALASQDGVALAVGDRLLVKNEATGSHNGVYEVTSLGAAGSKWKLTRIASMDESSEVVGGMQFNVLQGTQNGGVTFRLLTTGTITLGTTALTIGYASEWAALALLNSWANFETATYPGAGVRRSPDNRVTLRGLVKHEASISAPSVILTLPEGFRPSKELHLSIGASTAGVLGTAIITIAPAGTLLYFPPATGVVSFATFASISFYAD